MASGFRWVASLDSRRNPLGERGLPRKCLKMSQDFWRAGDGGFQVDSPAKRPDAGKLPRSAPPYTDRAQEEPWEGGGGVSQCAGSRRNPSRPSLQRQSGSSQLYAPILVVTIRAARMEQDCAKAAYQLLARDRQTLRGRVHAVRASGRHRSPRKDRRVGLDERYWRRLGRPLAATPI